MKKASREDHCNNCGMSLNGYALLEEKMLSVARLHEKMTAAIRLREIARQRALKRFIYQEIFGL